MCCCKVYADVGGLKLSTRDNPLVKARGLSPHTDIQNACTLLRGLPTSGHW